MSQVPPPPSCPFLPVPARVGLWGLPSPHPLPFTEEKTGPLGMAGSRGMAEHWEPGLQASVWFGSCSTLPQPHPSQSLPGQQEGAPLSTQIQRGPEGRAGDSHTAQPQQAGSGAPLLAPTCAPASLPTRTRGAWPLSAASRAQIQNSSYWVFSAPALWVLEIPGPQPHI